METPLNAPRMPKLTAYLRSIPLEASTKSTWASRSNTNSKSCSPPRGPASDTSTATPSAPSVSTLGPLKRKRQTVMLSEDTCIGSSSSKTQVEEEHDLEQEDLIHKCEEVVLSICWSQGKMGAAFYDARTYQIYVMNDKIESSPDFWILRTLYREISPKNVFGECAPLNIAAGECAPFPINRYLAVGSRQEPNLFRVLKELCTNQIDLSDKASTNTTTTNVQQSTDSQFGASSKRSSSDAVSSNRDEESSIADSEDGSTAKLFLLPASDYKYESSRKRVLLFPWPYLNRGSSDAEREAYLRPKIDFDAHSVVRALGGLLRFLEQKSQELFDNISSGTTAPIMGLQTYCMEDLMQVDDETLAYLQVFAEDMHPAAFKRGKSSSSKEGLSLYALLSRTASPLSPHVLRRIMLRPLKDIEVLESRYDFIDWASKPINFDTVRQLQKCLKNISNVKTLFSRLQRSQLKVRDWRILYSSLYNAIVLTEICQTQDHSIRAFSKVCEHTSDGLYQAMYLIQRTVDFNQADLEGRFVVKPGLDTELDDMKRRFHGLGNVLHKVAEVELKTLPQEVDSCCIIYIPHVGYLLAIPPSDLAASHGSVDATGTLSSAMANEEQQFNIPGLRFMFSTADMVLFKSSLCDELDIELGDLQVEIANRETSIMIRLVDEILKQSQSFIGLVHEALIIDVLLAFSLTSRDFGWTRPSLSRDSGVKVLEGRHPLYELCNPTFVSNDVTVERHQPVTLITGPNASGKTVYVKQVGILVYLAHLGCFVPAAEASFKIFDSISVVAISTPSVTSEFSSFMIELNRLCTSVSRSTSDSLVLVDEFGISTQEKDAISIYTSTLNFWTDQVNNQDQPQRDEILTRKTQHNDNHLPIPSSQEKKGCPTIFASTHFLKIYDLLSNQICIKCLCMETVRDGEKVIPLYQINNGRSSQSYAIQVAQAAGLPLHVVNRAKEVSKSLEMNQLPVRWGLIENEEEKSRCQEIISIFLDFDLASEPLPNLLNSLAHFLEDDLDGFIGTPMQESAKVDSRDNISSSDRNIPVETETGFQEEPEEMIVYPDISCIINRTSHSPYYDSSTGASVFSLYHNK